MVVGKAASFIWRILLTGHDLVFLGEIEVFMTTLGLAVASSSLAFPGALARFALRYKSKAAGYLKYAFKQTAAMFAITGAIIWLLFQSGILFTQNTRLPLLAFLILIWVVCAQKLALAYLNSQKKFFLYGLGEYVFSPLFKLALFIGILIKIFPDSFLFSHVIVSIFLGAGTVLALTWFTRTPSIANPLSAAEMKRFSSYSSFLNGSFLTFMIYGALDVYFLQYFFESQMVGVYAGLITLINLGDILFQPFLQTFQAHMADAKTRSKKIRFVFRTSNMLVKAGVIWSSATAVFGYFFLPLVSNNALQVSFSALLAFGIYKTLHFGIVHVYRHFLDFEGKQRFTAKTMAASLAVKLLVGICVIPQFGLGGLAMTNIIADLVHIWFLRRSGEFNENGLPRQARLA